MESTVSNDEMGMIRSATPSNDEVSVPFLPPLLILSNEADGCCVWYGQTIRVPLALYTFFTFPFPHDFLSPISSTSSSRFRPDRRNRNRNRNRRSTRSLMRHSDSPFLPFLLILQLALQFELASRTDDRSDLGSDLVGFASAEDVFG